MIKFVKYSTNIMGDVRERIYGYIFTRSSQSHYTDPIQASIIKIGIYAQI